MNNRIYSILISITLIFLAIFYFSKETITAENALFQKSDIVVISNPKAPTHKLRIVFTEELSIGEAEGDENYMFGQNIAFNTDEDGNFYVSELDTNRILKYDPEGKYLLAFGREGQGPGEFRNLSVPQFDKGNNLYITDRSNRRISFFDKDGKYLRQIRMQEIYDNLYINSKGFIVANKSSVSQKGNLRKRTNIYGLFDDKFNLVKELFKDEIETPMPTGTDASSLAELIAETFSILAFRPQVISTLTDYDFIYLGYPDKYEINVYSPEGKLVKKITRDYNPFPVNEKDKENYLKIVSESLSSPIFPDDIKKKALQKIKCPKYKPAYQSFTLMENGWLAVIVDSVEDEYTLFDIFDREGEYIANFKTPVPAEGMFSILFFKNDKAYSVVTEDDYKFVKRYNFEIQEYKGNRWIKSSIELNH